MPSQLRRLKIGHFAESTPERGNKGVSPKIRMGFRILHSLRLTLVPNKHWSSNEPQGENLTVRRATAAPVMSVRTRSVLVFCVLVFCQKPGFQHENGCKTRCVARVRISIRDLDNGTPPRFKDIQTSPLGTLHPQDTDDQVSWSNQHRRSDMSSIFRCELADLGT